MPRKTLSLAFLRPRSPLQNNDESPSSPASPLTPPPSSPPSSPSTASSSSSSSSSDPPTAPAPLHLRALLSPPPPARLNPRIQATAPKVPYPWIWKCHLCSSVYRLGVTRRCLEDGHFFCSIPAPPPSPPPSTISSSSSASDRDPQDALGAGFGDPAEQLLRAKERERKERRRERKRKAAKGCKAEFDYTGWSGYNDWRREARAIMYLEFGNLNNFDERVRSKKDCWRDCDFPSECLNEMVREREWRVQREKMRVLEEEWVKEQARVQGLMDVDSSSSSSPNDDGDVEMRGVEEIVTAQFYDVEKCSEHENVHGDDAEMRGVVTEEPGKEEQEENLGPLGTDCDGLGEESKEAAYAKCRRKSLDAAADGDVVPSSPLKECAFGFEDVDLGCRVWASEVGEGEVGVDVQMPEVGQET